MPDIPPTTSEAMLDDDRLYAREFGEDDEPEICGAELSQGGTCERLAEECPYHE